MFSLYFSLNLIYIIWVRLWYNCGTVPQLHPTVESTWIGGVHWNSTIRYNYRTVPQLHHTFPHIILFSGKRNWIWILTFFFLDLRAESSGEGQSKAVVDRLKEPSWSSLALPKHEEGWRLNLLKSIGLYLIIKRKKKIINGSKPNTQARSLNSQFSKAAKQNRP